MSGGYTTGGIRCSSGPLIMPDWLFPIKSLRGDGTTYIYCLGDPFTQEVRYIGKSIMPLTRLANHMNEKSPCHRTHWLQSLARQGRRPVLGILAYCDADGDWESLERDFIRRGREAGWPLTNGTDGGDGVPGLVPEARNRIAQAWRGRKHTPETLALMSRNRKGRKHTPEWKELMHEKMKDRVFTDEHRDRLSLSVRAFSDEQVATIKSRLDAGEKVKDLAEEFHAHRTTISKIKMGTYFAQMRKS